MKDATADQFTFNYTHTNTRMSIITITSPVPSAPVANKVEKTLTVTVDEIELSDDENERTFHDTDAAYVLPNE